MEDLREEVEGTLEDLREGAEAILEDQEWEEGDQIILEGCREEAGTRGTLEEGATIEEILEEGATTGEILGEVEITGEILEEIGEATGIGEAGTECKVTFFPKVTSMNSLLSK